MSYRICKYHGRDCEYPGRCLQRPPRKYDHDGALETIDPERLTLGNVVRMNGKGLHTFSDNVVIGIKVQYGTKRRAGGRVEHMHFNDLASALKDATKDDYVLVILARPYMYCSNAFGSMPNWLMGCEKYEIMGNRIVDSHKVVVSSTGEYTCHMSSELLHKWEVKVSGANSAEWAPKDGKVYDDLSEWGAKESFKIHRAMAQGAYGRKGGETVTLLCDGEVVEEYVGNMGTEV